MASQRQLQIRDLLREHGPLTIDQIIAHLAEAPPLPVQPLAPTKSGQLRLPLARTSQNPKTTIRNAIQSDALCRHAGDGRYVYLPSFVRGATVRVPMGPARGSGDLQAGGEVVALLWPASEGWGHEGPPPTLALDGGPTVTLAPSRSVSAAVRGLRFAVHAPTPFWRWWDGQRAGGADALVIRCRNGETGEFTAEATTTSALDPATRAERNAQLRAAAVEALRRTTGLEAEELGRRLLARGVYHAEPAPDALSLVLFDPPGPFCVEGMRQITYRPEMTPAFRRVFAQRLAAEASTYNPLLRRPWSLPEQDDDETDTAEEYESPRLGRAPEQLYRLKVSLQGSRSVWRLIEMLDNQPLSDLHEIIQDAFRWDRDHLYAFFMNGRRWDRLTKIPGDFYGESEPPVAEDVAIGDLELQPGQRFLYLFDFGDEWRHDVEVQEIVDAPRRGTFPRIVERHGKPPPQYATWDDE